MIPVNITEEMMVTPLADWLSGRVEISKVGGSIPGKTTR